MDKQVSLSELVRYLGFETTSVEDGINVNGIVLDSRQVHSGDLFVALVGSNTDGHGFIPDAVRRGTAAVVGTKSLGEIGIPYFQVQDGRTALATLAAAFWDFPARCLTVCDDQ